MGVACFLDPGLRRSAHVRQEILVQAAEDERKRKPAETGKKLPTVSLTLVSFAVTRKAYERITARFARQYEAKTGQAVRFRLSFGGSGTQVGAHTGKPVSLSCHPFLEIDIYPAPI